MVVSCCWKFTERPTVPVTVAAGVQLTAFNASSISSLSVGLRPDDKPLFNRDELPGVETRSIIRLDISIEQLHKWINTNNILQNTARSDEDTTRTSDVNKGWTHKDNDKDKIYKYKDKDLTHKDQDKDKDYTCKDKDKDKY